MGFEKITKPMKTALNKTGEIIKNLPPQTGNPANTTTDPGATQGSPPIDPGKTWGPESVASTPADYSAINNRFNELIADAQRKEGRNLQGVQNALSRKYAALGMSGSGSSVGSLRLAAQDSARNMSSIQSQMGAEKYGQMAQLDESNRQRDFTAREAGKERMWKSAESGLDRALASKELDMNIKIATANMKIAGEMMKLNRRGLLDSITQDIFGGNIWGTVGGIAGGIGGFVYGGPWGAAAGAVAGNKLGNAIS
jgi:hypothetical protein